MSSLATRLVSRLQFLPLVVDLACAANTDDSMSGSGHASACTPFATSVVDHEFGEGASEGQGPDEFPDRVLGPPQGRGCCAGGLDVTSLGNGGVIVLAFDAVILDGPGDDFIVFENAFNVGGDPEAPFAELATVEVSDDGETWHEFPCEALEYPYDQCAGWHPVLANDEQPFDPDHPEAAGGDAFDLAAVGLESATWVRITDRADLSEALDCCFDLDAVALINFECDEPTSGDE